MVSDGAGVVLMPFLVVPVNRRHYTPSNHSERLALELSVCAKTGNNPTLDMFPSKERSAEVVKSMYKNRALRTRLKQCLSDICSTRK